MRHTELIASNVEWRVACFVAGALLVALLCWGLRRLRGTTLVGPCWWAIAASTGLTILAERHFAGGGLTSPAVRFAVAAATFCPLMAVLGAKRPQHRGWQWVVASLWLVLVWPAGQAILSRSELSLFVAWKIFLVGLVLVGIANYVNTRNWAASLLVAAGQLALFAEFIWPESTFDNGQTLAVTIVCFFVASVVVAVRTKAANHGDELPASLAGRTAKWQAFRDSYGSLWGLRIQGRVNETAELRGWPFRLDWKGFECLDRADPTDMQLAELDDSWATLMRRFW